MPEHERHARVRVALPVEVAHAARDRAGHAIEQDPVVQADDPTPTPVTNPDLLLAHGGVPFVERMPDEEDPTPTPTTQE